MAGVNPSAIQSQITNPVNLGLGSAAVSLEAQAHATGTGVYNGQAVTSASTNASEAFRDVGEGGLSAEVQRFVARLMGKQTTNAKQVTQRAPAGDTGSDSSASADEEPHSAIRRVAAFLELSRGGGGAGGGTGDQSGQHQATLVKVRQSADEKVTKLTDALRTLGTIRGSTREELLDGIRDALSAFSSDPTQQLLALEAILANTGLYPGSLDEALLEVRRDYTEGNLGVDMQVLLRDAYMAVNLQQARELSRSSDPADKRASMTFQLVNIDPAEKAGGLRATLDWLNKSDPDTATSPAALQDILQTQLQSVGRELSAHEGSAMDGAHLRALLSVIDEVKQFNTLYDSAGELISNSKLKESDSFNRVTVMSFFLSFVANPAPDLREGVDLLNDFGMASRPAPAFIPEYPMLAATA